MTDIDRLIELIKQATTSYLDYLDSIDQKGLTDTEGRAKFTADHLLANGVIVPPCKVGDTVYVITTKRPCYACVLCTDYCHKNCSFNDKNELVVKIARVCAIKYETIGKVCVEIDKSKICHSYDYTYLFEDFGKTVFPTKKEAEAKLKECEG